MTSKYYVSGVIEIDGTCGRVADADAEYWTVYEKQTDGTTLALCNCYTRKAADEVAMKLRALDGLPVDALIGGWTAVGLSKYTARLEAQLAELAKQKPVGSFHIYDGRVDGTTDYVRDGEWPIDEGELLVYARAAPPASVLPGEHYDKDGSVTSDFDRGWNACRAEVLRCTAKVVADEADLLASASPKAIATGLLQRRGSVTVNISNEAFTLACCVLKCAQKTSIEEAFRELERLFYSPQELQKLHRIRVEWHQELTDFLDRSIQENSP